MLRDFKKSTEKEGLEIHPSKTKVLSCEKTKGGLNRQHQGGSTAKNESATYLGQTTTFEQ